MKTVQQVEKLKEQWLKEANLDVKIEETIGFQEYKEELLSFRKESKLEFQLHSSVDDITSGISNFTQAALKLEKHHNPDMKMNCKKTFKKIKKDVIDLMMIQLNELAPESKKLRL
jgi:hypothetical protein